jgi:hypothetical protein
MEPAATLSRDRAGIKESAGRLADDARTIVAKSPLSTASLRPATRAAAPPEMAVQHEMQAMCHRNGRDF